MPPAVIVCLSALAGAFTWSFLEYVFHRWAGHHPTFRKKNFFGPEHTRHHSEGDYFTAGWKKGAAAVVVLTLVGVPTFVAFGIYGIAYAVGLAGFYACYEAFHFRAHSHAGITAYGRYMRRHHFFHHFENTAANHGVTSPIWDVVFGTYEPASMIRVPRKLQMVWLADPETGEVREQHAPFYSFRGKKKKAA